ncbi:PRA1 family protein F4-like [Magnolia sinica]|uniref:PRA1 family protein F4-like n=1 Tax=Magnolia sinica TaxID=86752 RepID=UPI002657BC2D|nr:PRA1 family protein F4-like [Magnolia sinica]
MAIYGTVQRPSTLASSAFTEPARPRPGSDRRVPSGFSLLRSFNIPSSAEAAAVRIIRNLGYFRVLYILLLWSILFMSLVPRRRVSLIFLVATTAVSCLYLLLLQAVPDSVVLHKIIDRRLVLALLMIVTIVELVLTCATIHLLVSLAIGVPIILVHAVLRSQDDLFVNEQASAAGELVPLVDKKDSDLESLA